MKNVAFAPGSVQAKVGQTVTFKNEDSPAHNVTYVSGPKFTSSGQINPGQSFPLKLTQAGTIHYYCTIHPFMKAEIVVSQIAVRLPRRFPDCMQFVNLGLT